MPPPSVRKPEHSFHLEIDSDKEKRHNDASKKGNGAIGRRRRHASQGLSKGFAINFHPLPPPPHTTTVDEPPHHLLSHQLAQSTTPQFLPTHTTRPGGERQEHAANGRQSSPRRHAALAPPSPPQHGPRTAPPPPQRGPRAAVVVEARPTLRRRRGSAALAPPLLPPPTAFGRSTPCPRRSRRPAPRGQIRPREHRIWPPRCRIPSLPRRRARLPPPGSPRSAPSPSRQRRRVAVVTPRRRHPSSPHGCPATNSDGGETERGEEGGWRRRRLGFAPEPLLLATDWLSRLHFFLNPRRSMICKPWMIEYSLVQILILPSSSSACTSPAMLLYLVHDFM
jgi:hypothetical protein